LLPEDGSAPAVGMHPDSPAVPALHAPEHPEDPAS
jgi:hypothetical protein